MNISTKFVPKCAEIVWSIKSHEIAEIQWSVTKSPWGLWTPLLRISTKFEVNPMISMSKDVQKLDA